MKLTASIQGADELQRVLRKLPTEALQESAMEKGTRAGAKVVAEEQRGYAPESGDSDHGGYGSLVDNIRVNKAPKNMRLRRLRGHMIVHNGDAFWGLFLEFGTVKMSAQPWARPANDAAWRDAVQETGRRLVKVVDTEAKRLAGRFGALGKARKRRLTR
jgi:HK97 gp10 family phage protein